MEEFLTVKEVATELKISIETVKRMCRSGELVAVKVRRQWRIDKADYEERKKLRRFAPSQES